MRTSWGREGVGFAVALASAVALVMPGGALASTRAPSITYVRSCVAGSGCVIVAKDSHSSARNLSSASLSPRVPARPLASTFYGWSGATPAGPGANNWSIAANWAGGVAPSGTVGTLSFPILTNSACTSTPPTDACYQSNNNIAGLTANAMSLDDGAQYFITGNAITLAGGGLSASTTSTTFGDPQLSLPIMLGAAQTWTIDGGPSGSQVELGTTVSGASDALTINLNHQAFLGVDTSDVEVGPVTISGASTTSFNGGVGLSGGKLNGTDGSSVSLTGPTTSLVAAPNPTTHDPNSTIGALTASGGTTQVGVGTAAGILSVNGGATFGSSTTLQVSIPQAGTIAGTDYSQLSASGPVSLGGTLILFGQNSSGGCPTLNVGDVDTLITTTGALSGTFNGVPNGTTLSLACGPTAPTVRINYSAKAVTATVLTAGGGGATPTVKSVTPDAGSTAGGNTIVIKGTNFAPGATVQFGAAASPAVTFVSATEVKAVAPPHPSGVVDVTVTSGGSTSATSKSDLYAYGAPTVTSFTPTSGITGSKVTITGTDFVPAAKVNFGTLAAKISFVSPTQLKATVPNGAVPGAISVVTKAGTGTSSTNFTPTLSITSFSPGSGSVGTLVTINGVGFTSTSTVKFNGIVASSVTFVSANQMQATVPSGATTGSIQITNSVAPKGTVRSAGNFTVT